MNIGAKNAGMTIVKSILILIAASLLGLFWLVLVYAVPVNPQKAESTLEYLDKMGWSPSVGKRYEQFTSHFDTFESDVLDDGTDKLILTYSLDDSQGSLLDRVLYMQGYGRYWHGYAALLRPILYLTDYWNFSLYNGMGQIVLAFLLALLVRKQTGQLRYALAALSSYLLLMPPALAASLQYSPVFYLAFAGSIAAVLLKDYLSEKDRLILFFLCMGILTCYFDFLTYPLLTWAFPLCWYLVVKKDALSVLRQYVVVLFSGLAWIFGYVGMFLGKWLLLYLICGPERYAECDAGRAFSYLGVVEDELKAVKETYSRFDTLYTNWRHYLFGGFVFIISVWLLWMLYTKFRYHWKVKRECVPLLLISLSSPAWYLVFSAHTAIHHFFTYRTYGAGILAVLLFLCGCAEAGGKGADGEEPDGRGAGGEEPDGKVSDGKDADEKREWLGEVLSWVVCLLLGVAFSMTARENVLAVSSGDYQLVELAPGDVFECGFRPTFDDIRKFGVLAGAVGDDRAGSLRVKLYDDMYDNKLLYETEFPVSLLADKLYVTNYVEWKLKPGKEYLITFSVEGNEKGAAFYVTDTGSMPLREYRNSRLNGTEFGEAQPFGSVEYNAVVQSKRVRGYLAFLIGCYLWMIYGSAVSVFRKSI